MVGSGRGRPWSDETRGWWRRATCCIKEAATVLVEEETAVALIEEVQGWR
jgi:hypothetical protein